MKIDGLTATDARRHFEVITRDESEAARVYRKRARQPFRDPPCEAGTLVLELDGVRLYVEGERYTLTRKERKPKLDGLLWRLYYEDGTTFDNLVGEPWESPVWGVVLAIQPHLKGNEQLMMNGDVLMWRVDLKQWTQCGDGGFFDHATAYGHVIDCFRKTRWTHGGVHHGHYKELLERARADIKVANDG